jgi:hypothetical protein
MVGVSNGGNSVLRFATLWPELCCGLLVVTGSIQGLVELPAGLQRLGGLPIDMYVGTEDECGFYEPMVAMEEDLRKVGHSPPATLTVFKKAGHCCSPLVDNYLLHSKILLMLLYAGATGDSLDIGVPETALPIDEVYVELICFCDKLGITWSKTESGGLRVSSTTFQSHVPQPVPSPKQQGRAHSFRKSDCVEVWSNYSHTWLIAEVMEVSDQGVSVSFNDDRGVMSKMILSRYIKDFLRTPDAAAAVCRRPFVKGDRVEIWSNSQQKWFEDGKVHEVSADGSLTVLFNGLAMSKMIRAEEADQCLRIPWAPGPAL